MSTFTRLTPNDVEAIIRTTWKRQAPERPSERVTITLPFSWTVVLGRGFKKAASEWEFVERFERRDDAPGFGRARGIWWLHVVCKPYDAVQR